MFLLEGSKEGNTKRKRVISICYKMLVKVIYSKSIINHTLYLSKFFNFLWTSKFLNKHYFKVVNIKNLILFSCISCTLIYLFINKKFGYSKKYKYYYPYTCASVHTHVRVFFFFGQTHVREFERDLLTPGSNLTHTSIFDSIFFKYWNEFLSNRISL